MTADDFRRARRLYDLGETELWLSTNHLGLTQFRALLKQELILKVLKDIAGAELDVYMRDQLRVDGRYSTLVARVQNKRRLLESYDLDRTEPAGDGPTDEELLRWYFTQQRGVRVPSDVSAYSRSLGFVDECVFLSAIQREFWYVKITETAENRAVAGQLQAQG